MNAAPSEFVLEAANLAKSFGGGRKGALVQALDGVSFNVRRGGIAALVGPDGAGKTTLLRIAAGLMRQDSGELRIFGVKAGADKGAIQADIGYMPQKFGLYEDLTVGENLDLYADLRGLDRRERAERYAALLEMTGLEGFRGRLAGRLSGGMKQKLGLICTLVRPPRLLLLDEPAVGVDPLSRRELWHILGQLSAQSGMSVLVSTANLDEAALCGDLTLLFAGQVLARGRPEEVRALADGLSYSARPLAGDTPRAMQARLRRAPGVIDALPQGGAVRFVHAELNEERLAHLDAPLAGAVPQPVPPSLEDSFMLLLSRHSAPNGRFPDYETQPPKNAPPVRPSALPDPEPTRHSGAERGEPVIETRDVLRVFGDFIAVNRISFSVYRGEVFGLLGPNGAGKTTTFRMLCGLLPASAGTLRVAGVDVREAREEARQRLGYVAQKFSLYAPLSVWENLEFFAGAYGLKGGRKEKRLRAALEDFSLEKYRDMPAGNLPGGYKQRLAMAVGLLHEPAILFLDEPTSGADPMARREFWGRISDLAQSGVTIVVTTHLMEEAEYCDRILIQDRGRMLALDTPGNIRALASGGGADKSVASMDDAFVAIVKRARNNLEGAGQ